MASLLKSLLILTILLGFSGPTWAYKLSPCLRVLMLKNGQLTQGAIRKINFCGALDDKYKLAVHEHMTAASMLEYRGKLPLEPLANGWKYQYMIEGSWSKESGRSHNSHALMFGTWWNDDPLMRTWGQGLRDFVKGALDDGKIMKDGKSYYPGDGCMVPADVHLARWSHFGKLQHLHFMTDLKEDESQANLRVTTTTDRALKWMAFAYRVAIGELPPEQPLTGELQDEAGLPSISLNHCVTDPKNVKIRTVFSRRGQLNSYRNEITPDVAIGSMLHVMQDSFSPAHTCRVVRGEGASQHALLADVYNYNEQIADEHGKLDVYPPWLILYVTTGKRTYDNDPVAVGAWLLQAVDQRLPWTEVEKHLRNTIFAQAQPSADLQKEACLGPADATASLKISARPKTPAIAQLAHVHQ